MSPAAWLPGSGSYGNGCRGPGVLHTGLAYLLLYGGMAQLSTGRIVPLQVVYPDAAVAVNWAVYAARSARCRWLGIAAIAAALSAARG